MRIIGEGWEYLTSAEKQWLVNHWRLYPLGLAKIPFVPIDKILPINFSYSGMMGRILWKLHLMKMDDIAGLEHMKGKDGEDTKPTGWGTKMKTAACCVRGSQLSCITGKS